MVTIPGDPEAMIAASQPGFEMHLVASGIEVDDRWGWIVELSAGGAFSVRGFFDQGEALEAAGLRD